jgi:hypothetical protein
MVAPAGAAVGAAQDTTRFPPLAIVLTVAKGAIGAVVETPVFDPTAERSRIASDRSNRTSRVTNGGWRRLATRSRRSFEHHRFDPPAP